MTVPLRVLQVLADTDDSAANSVGLALHAALTRAGLELRTVALAPGRRGEHAALIPVVAPGRRSVAALTQLHAESRWADVVVFHGVRAVPPGYRLLRSRPPGLLVLHGDDRIRRARWGAAASLHAVTLDSATVGGRRVEPAPAVVDPSLDPDPAAWIGLLREISLG